MKSFKWVNYLCLLLLLFVPIAHAQEQMETVPAGTPLLVRTSEGIDSKTHKIGDRFTAKLEADLMAEDEIVALAGSTVYVRLIESKSAGRTKGKSELQIELTDIVVGENSYPLLSDDYKVAGRSETKMTAKRTVRGVGLGAAIAVIRGASAAQGAATGRLSIMQCL